MTLSILEFAQLCLKDIDHEYLTLFDSKRGQSGSISTYPDAWCERYISQKYNEHDYAFCKYLYLPVVWGEHVAKNIPPMQKRIFLEAQDFQIYKGITIPYLSTDNREFITLTFHKGEKLSSHKLQTLSMELRNLGQIIFCYKRILEHGACDAQVAIQFLEEVTMWKDQHRQQKKNHTLTINDILNDINTCQLFIAHHETKELGLDLLRNLYKDIARNL
jgi:hypothetical protein